jgi:hypothetical protein
MNRKYVPKMKSLKHYLLLTGRRRSVLYNQAILRNRTRAELVNSKYYRGILDKHNFSHFCPSSNIDDLHVFSINEKCIKRKGKEMYMLATIYYTYSDKSFIKMWTFKCVISKDGSLFYLTESEYLMRKVLGRYKITFFKEDFIQKYSSLQLLMVDFVKNCYLGFLSLYLPFSLYNSIIEGYSIFGRTPPSLQKICTSFINSFFYNDRNLIRAMLPAKFQNIFHMIRKKRRQQLYILRSII